MADNTDPKPPSAPMDMALFRGLPLKDIIAAPLSAASDAQAMMARSTVEFIDAVGLNPAAPGAQGQRTAREIQFSVTRPLQQADGLIRQERVEMSVPLLSLVTMPNLQVQSVSVDFEMRVKSSTSVEEQERLVGRRDESDPGSPGTPGSGGQNARPRVYLHGEVASQKEQTRQSDTSARIRVHVQAGQAPPPEGLSRVLDILATSCAPRAIVPSPLPGRTGGSGR